MFFGDDDELLEIEFVVPFDELLFEEVDGEFIEVEGHIGDHFFVPGFDFFVAGARGIDGGDFVEVAVVA